MARFLKLFQPGKIGKLELKNRIIFPPIGTMYATNDASVSDRHINYYSERARGGCGLLVVEAVYARSGGYPRRINVDNDRIIPDLRKLAEAIHSGGAKACVQLSTHRGRSDEVDPASPSENTHPKTGARARAVSIADILQMEKEFGEGARRIKEAGFDALMIHGGSGYLVSEFMSPRLNRRTDEYGGDTKKRAKFALELVATVKEKTGADYPVIFRLTADERVEGGFGIEEAIVVSKLLEEAGADAIDVISGTAETFAWVIPYMYMPVGCNADLSEAIKKKIKIPVSVAGRINDPYAAEEILENAKADFVSLGRTLIADPQFPNKARAGKVADIRKCIACCRCVESILKDTSGTMYCAVNPAVGKEKQFESGLKPVTKKKKVLVIGGGPAGMEAAIIMAQRGHEVTLWERDYRLGGQLNLAVVPPGKKEVLSFVEYLIHSLKQLKVRVELRKRATAEAVLEFSPDAVVVAAGSEPLIPKIKGAERKRVVSSRAVLSGKIGVGERIIVIGGGFVGCETADFLAEKGKKITIIEILPELASELFYPYARLIIQKLKDKAVEVFTGVKDEEITDKGVEIVDKDGKRISLEADDIVISIGSVADNTLFESLTGKIPELYQVGDCIKARRICEAVSEGAEVGLRI